MVLGSFIPLHAVGIHALPLTFLKNMLQILTEMQTMSVHMAWMDLVVLGCTAFKKAYVRKILVSSITMKLHRYQDVLWINLIVILT